MTAKKLTYEDRKALGQVSVMFWASREEAEQLDELEELTGLSRSGALRYAITAGIRAAIDSSKNGKKRPTPSLPAEEAEETPRAEAKPTRKAPLTLDEADDEDDETERPTPPRKVGRIRRVDISDKPKSLGAQLREKGVKIKPIGRVIQSRRSLLDPR